MGLPIALQKYYSVIQKLGPYQVRGNEILCHCCFAERHKSGDTHPSLTVYVGRSKGELQAYCRGCKCRGREVAERIGTPFREWWNDGAKLMTSDIKPKLVAEYPYTLDGKLIATKLRYEPGRHGDRKDFFWKREVTINGSKAIAWSLKSGAYKRYKVENGIPHLKKDDAGDIQLGELISIPPYRIDEVRLADPKRVVFIVEGEKCVESMRSAGMLATTGYAGKGKWIHSDGKYYAGRRVIVLPDIDGTGRGKGIEIVTASLIEHRAASIQVVYLPSDRLKQDKTGDIYDFSERAKLDKLDVAKSLAQVVRQFPMYVIK